jgi:spectinomycin phosphotransferase
VVGSRIARAVEPREEAPFFAGYGPAEVDPEALVSYRYERLVEDLGEFGRGVFLEPRLGEPARAAAAELAMGVFAPGGTIELAETVTRHRPPSESA